MNNKVLVVLIIVAVVIIGAGAFYFLQQPGSSQYSNQLNTDSNRPSQSSNNQSSSSETSISPETYNITIQNLSFNPAQLTIKRGDTITWTNKDSMNHQISGNGFQSSAFGNGQTFSFTFNAAGTFDYICLIHPYMKGKIVVQ